MSCCELSITRLIRWIQNMLPMMRWTILTRWLRTLWPLLVGFSSSSHIPQGKEQVIVKSWTCLCKCKMSGVSDESEEWWISLWVVRRYLGWDLVPSTTNNTDHHHTEVKWLESPSAAQLMDGWSGNIQICTQRLLVLSSLPNSPWRWYCHYRQNDALLLPCSPRLQPDGKTLISICYCLASRCIFLQNR